MSFTQNDRSKRDIINNIITLTKRGADTIYTVIPTEYQKYPSTIILKHENVLAKADKLPYDRWHSITPHEAYSISIHAITMTPADISDKKRRKIAIIQLFQNLYV